MIRTTRTLSDRGSFVPPWQNKTVLPLADEDPREVGTLRLLGRLGTGGMGQVYAGSTMAGRAVAVKVIHPELAADPAFRARFRAEVAAARKVSGAYTAPVVAAGLDDYPPWMATALVAGPSLAEAVASAGPFPPEAVSRLAAGLVEALAAIHECRLVHRDLKPSNVLLAADGPRVIDFGISRAMDGTALTATGLIVGTPAFMSPERAEGRPAGPESDVFALGAVLVFAANGIGPFGDGHPADVLYRVVHTEPSLGLVPAGLRDLVAGCLAADPAARPALPALAQAIAAATPAPGPATGSSRSGSPGFWPAEVNRLIRERQELLAPVAGNGAASASPGGPGRRRVLVALAGVGAAGLAAGGWVVSGGGGSRPRSSPGVSPRRSPPSTSTAPVLPPGTELWSTTVIRAPVNDAPAVSGDVVYVWSGPIGTTLSAVSAASGSPRWRVTASQSELAFTATGGAIYCLTGGNPSLYALRASDGRQMWHGDIGGGAQPQKPLVVGDRLYLAGLNNAVYALVATTGTALWSTPLNAMPAGLAMAGGTVYAMDQSGYLYALDAARGSLRWTVRASAQGTAGTPAAAGGSVYVTGAGDNLDAVRAVDGKQLWTTRIAGRAATNPVVSGGVVYIAGYDGYLNALNAATGAVSWRTRIAGSVNSQPQVAGGNVFVGGGDHRLHVLRASDGAAVWSSRLGGDGLFAPAQGGGIVYAIGSYKRLYALSV